jgi:hypothetical protein
VKKTNKCHLIIGSIIFVIHTLSLFFAGRWSHFYCYYYSPTVEFLHKPSIIVFILMLLLKWTQLFAINKRIIYIYIYYSLIYYGSGMLGGILGIFFAWRLVEMGLL